MAQRQDFLPTISGVSKIPTASITAEIGYINRFESLDKLDAFANSDPHNIQNRKICPDEAGDTQKRRPESALAAFYQHKLAEGKHLNTALGAV